MYFIQNLKKSLFFISYIGLKEAIGGAGTESIEQKALSGLDDSQKAKVEKVISDSNFSKKQEKDFYNTLSSGDSSLRASELSKLYAEVITITDIDGYLSTLKTSLKSDEQIQGDISGKDGIDVANLKGKQKEFYEGIQELRSKLESPQVKIAFIGKMKKYIDSKLDEDFKKELKEDLKNGETGAKQFVVFIDGLASRLSLAIAEETKISEEIIMELANLKEDIKKTSDKIEYDSGIEVEGNKITEDAFNKENLKKMGNKEFLNISPEKRLQHITKNHVDASSLSSGQVDDIEITFKFEGVTNDALYKKTTAGQVLPREVGIVKSGGMIYERKGLDGEFFAQGNKRLIIKEGSNLHIEKIRSKSDIDTIIKNNKLSSTEFKNSKEYKKGFDDIVEEAIERGIDPKFAVLAFSKKVGETSNAMERGVLIEEMFTQYDRQKGKLVGVNKDVNDLIKISILKEYTQDWEKEAKDLGIKKDVINTVKQPNSKNGLFVSKNYNRSELNKTYEKGTTLSYDIKEKLNKIYNTENISDKRMLDTIEKLSDYKNFKNNVALFLIDAYKIYGSKITQANGNLGGLRSLKQQSDIINKGNGATKIKDPSHSYHTKGQAIDLKVSSSNIKLVQLGAKHGLWNGQEMWGWDHVHFQSEYSGSRSKKSGRLAKMKNRGTLPKVA